MTEPLRPVAAGVPVPTSTSLPAVRARRRAIAGASIGSAIEYYDYGIYGYLAATIGDLFFAGESQAAELLSAFAVFAISFVVRPLGGIILGHLGDRHGRRMVLALAVITMSLGTFLIGVLPTYGAIGVAAPLLLVIARLVQGLSAGGENPGAASLIAEMSPPARRGLLCSMPQLGSMIGLLMASAVIGILDVTASPAAIASWGWRIPFILALPFGLIGLYIRLRIDETAPFKKAEARGEIVRFPLFEVIARHPGPILRVIGICVLDFAGYYIVFVYLKTYLHQEAHLGSAGASWSTTATLLFAALAMPVFGHLSDRLGRKRVIAGSCVAFLVFTIPMFMLMGTGNLALVIIGQVVLGLCVAAIMGALFATLAELFGTRVRYTGFALGFNIAAVATGGISPLISTWLINQTGNGFAPGFFMMGSALVTLLTLFTIRETARSEL